MIRTEYNINKGWKFFMPADAAGMVNNAHGREYPEYDDSEWQIVDLPHDYMLDTEISDKYFGNQGWRPGNLGWYRKNIDLESVAGKTYILEIDGAYRKAEVWVNGEYVCIHKNGYTSFAPDITKYLKNGENLIAVRTDCLDIPNARYYTGSGIYRNVRLVETGQAFISYSGIAITTPSISSEKAVVHIEAEFTGNVTAAEFEVFSPEGVSVGKAKAEIRDGIAAGDVIVENPKLWDLDTPYMYQARTVVYSDGTATDDKCTDFGIRTIEYRPGEGFFLNGVETKMRGFSLHSEAGPFGAAIPVSFWEYRLKKLKEIGCNAIALSHNQHAPEFVDLCDRMGFLVNGQFTDKWEPPHYVDFYEEWEHDLVDWIKRDRNHPSIVMWSFGCENNAVDPTGTMYLNHRLKMFADLTRKIDNTRPLTTSHDPGPDELENRGHLILAASKYMDIVGCNYADEWADDIFKEKPDALFLSTESYVYYTSNHERRFCQREEDPWFKHLKDKRIIGEYKWVAFDYLGEAQWFWPLHGFYGGAYDWVCGKKPVAYHIQSVWDDKPMVSLSVYRQDPDVFRNEVILDQWMFPVTDFCWRTDKEYVDLATYSNCEEVELFVNGKSQGVQYLKDVPNRVFKWRKIKFEPGEAYVIGRNKGEKAAEFKLSSCGVPYKLELTPYKTELTADGEDVVGIEIKALDKDGNWCTDCSETVTFDIQGAGDIIRTGNSDLGSHKSFFDKDVALYYGRAMVFIRSKEEAGNVKLTARIPGVEAAVEIEVK